MQYNQPAAGPTGYPYPAPPPSYDQVVHVQAPLRVVQAAAPPPQMVIIQRGLPRKYLNGVYYRGQLIVSDTNAPLVGPDPSFITCPHCHVQKLTRVEYAPSVKTHCMAALLCMVGLWCCACLPYCSTSCMNANHFCGNCNKFVGVYSSE
ncbi:hypothetical protein KR009_008208 [Drosophila setifemur]|nr:hypothetical protein KR009_008208 [Drosophila setifemur]